eukprot:711264_1
MATYSTKQHSALLKTFDQKMGDIEKDRSKELIFNILLPVQKMNNDIYNLTSQYPEFIDNNESSAFLDQLNVFNANIVKILNNEAIAPAKDNNTTQDNTDETTDTNTAQSNGGNIDMALHQLIDILMLTDIRPIEYDKDLLISLLISNDITNQNVLEHKARMISILEDCRFPKQRAQFTMEQIERNLGSKTQAISDGNTSSNKMQVVVAKPEEAEAEDVEDVVDLTMMAIEALFEGQMNVNRPQLNAVYKENNIDTLKLSTITEMEFASILGKCGASNGYTTVANTLTKPKCIAIHRAIKSLLNIKTTHRFDIDIGLAVIYLITEDNTFIQKDITIQPDKVMAAFKPYSAQDFHQMGKKEFIKVLQTQTDIKMCHATKLFNTIRAFIEDSNVKCPPQILVEEDKTKPEEEEEEVQDKTDQLQQEQGTAEKDAAVDVEWLTQFCLHVHMH